jgi:hypothetical protein
LNLFYIGFHKDKKLGTVVEFICPKHESKGIQYKDWSHFRLNKIGCVYCSGRNRSNEDIVHLIKNKDVILISDYIGYEKPITCKCKICGNEWSTTPKSLISNGSGCPMCGAIKAQKSRTKTLQQFIEELSSINPNIEVVGDYVNTHTKIKCRCKIDGHVWEGYPANLLNSTAGCPVCHLSIGENKLLNVLKNLNINFIPQYSVEGCEYKYKLRFDAYDTDNNIAFEFNGEQHYYPVDWGNKGIEWAKQEFEITQKRDLIKQEYCNNNKIPIIKIPYWERDNMEFFICNELDKIKERKAI